MNNTWSTQTRVFVIAVLTILFAAFIYFSLDLLTPIVIASLLAFMLYPLVTFIRRRTPLNHRAAAMVVFLLFLAVIIVIPATVTPVIIREADSLGRQLTTIIDQLNSFAEHTTVLGYKIFSGVPTSIEDSMGEMLAPDRLYESIAAITENAVWVGVIVIIIYYLLVDWGNARKAVFNQIPNEFRRDAYHLFVRLRKIWDVYLRGQLLTMGIIGVISGIAAAILGLPAAVVLGLVAAFFAVAPSIGSTAFIFVAGAVALIVPAGGIFSSQIWYIAVVVIVYLCIHLFDNYWLRPRILGQNLRLHPGIVLVAVLGALMLGGPVLALVIVPVISSAGVVLAYITAKVTDNDPWKPGRKRSSIAEFIQEMEAEKQALAQAAGTDAEEAPEG